MRKLFDFIIHPVLWKLILLVILALAIWFIGPLFAIAEWRPLEPVLHRGLLIFSVLFYFGVKKLLGVWRERRVNERFMQALANKGASDIQSSSVLDELGKNFALAMTHLKSSTANARTGFFSSMRQRFVYQFPWYVFIGAPGSGKTTALINSGLQFPLTDVLGRESLKGVGGTRNCDWWFTEDAVFIDTAGRYITHESHAQQDKDEWAGFLGLLKKFRPRQPLNGAVLTISIADLLTGSEQSRNQHAAIIRARLGELSNSLGINFPVYILITKADLLGGFSDYFSMLSKEDRDQVLGFSFSDQSAHTSPLARDITPVSTDLAVRVRQELDLLGQRLFDGLSDLLVRETDITRRAHSFAFPQNFANCLPSIADLIEKIFSGVDVSGVQLRGVYFASGTQEGTPFDRVLGALGRRFGVSSSINTQRKMVSGRSYFLKDLITRVILPEAHLAGKNRRAEKRELLIGLIVHSLILLACATFIFLLVGSYLKNRDYLISVDQKVALISSAVDKTSAADIRGIVDYLPLLNALCCVADGDTFAVLSPPLEMTYGLYQGEKLDAATQRTYARALQETLLPWVSRRLQQLLVDSGDQDMNNTYQTLKAYLMLNQAEHYNPAQLLAYVEADIERHFAAGISREQQAGLIFHLRQLFGAEAQMSPYAMDEKLVLSTRRSLSGFSFAERAYQTIKVDLLQQSALADVSFLTAGGAKSNFVFERNSGKPLSDGVPGLFTRKGYKEIFLPAVQDQLKATVVEESWVLGEYSSFSEKELTAERMTDIEQVLIRLYLQDYSSFWDSYLIDLRLISTRSMSESIDVARILSASDSPLWQLVSNFSPELSLGKDLSLTSQIAGKEVKRRIAEKTSGFDQSLQGLAANLTRSDAVESVVDGRFKEMIELTHGANKETEKNTLLKLFNEVYLGLSNADFSIRSGARSLENDDAMFKVRSEAARYPIPVRTILEGLTDEGKRQTEGGIRGALNAELDSSIGEFCRMAISGRYPIDRRSTRDVTFADFSKMFAPAGLMDSFFNENLRTITDTTGRVWTMRQAADVPLPITSFQQAARIRDVFFPAAVRAPMLNFEYKVLEMDAGISQLSMDFDGQLFQYAHGPQIPRSVSWPGPLGSNQIRIELSGADLNRKTLVVNGPWAIMRLFDLGERRQLLPEKFVTTLFIHGQKVVLEVTATSVNNPFYLAELASFSCPARR
ncbi:type VI secretion system membrane subunit TssM [Cellvibrio sp. KY-GH-1]|uniref:type VI secretion system membrane subunit TssM n=1 Tax=Cellvibrio sp. KY-GH-1 TaxID=2303332 RepID=UPI0012A1B20E|nr:type VI secretion system membrane subunit TssM [Cellvibrio sp. KY-GH-1]QEY16727.1 type VI secretion system membrane subunit TssM [Cellvibrio sp. KY-GH-1]